MTRIGSSSESFHHDYIDCNVLHSKIFLTQQLLHMKGFREAVDVLVVQLVKQGTETAGLRSPHKLC